LPDSKTGAKTLQLPPPALSVLAELPRLEDNPYVIVGGFQLGGHRARHHPNGEYDRAGVGTITASMMGLMSFTLGLTIGYAQDRAETRRGLVVHEASAISSAWLRAKLVRGDEGRTIGELIEQFAKIELAFTVAQSTGPEAELLVQRQELKNRIWELMRTVMWDDPPPTSTALSNALSEMF
jgi:hypothetical protein